MSVMLLLVTGGIKKYDEILGKTLTFLPSFVKFAQWFKGLKWHNASTLILQTYLFSFFFKCFI